MPSQGIMQKLLKRTQAPRFAMEYFQVICTNLICRHMNGRDLNVIDYVHVPPLLCLCEASGYRGTELCVLAGMTWQERLKLTGNKKRTKDHPQDGAECKQYEPIKDKFWTNEYFEFDVAESECILSN